MEIDKIPISEIQPYPNNPRKNSRAVDVVAKSIKEFGFKNPIILDKNNIIIAGHTRLLAAKKLGIVEVPVIWADDLTEDQVKAFRIMDNRSAQYSEWNDDLLKMEIKGLDELDFDTELTGLTSFEIGDLLGGGEINPDEFVEVDAYEKAKANNSIKNGEMWQLGEHNLMCGDSTNVDDVNRLLGKERPILMVTDPPYGVNYDPKWRDEADKKEILRNKYPVRALGEVENDDKIDWSEAYKLFPGDVMYVYHSGKFASEVAESIKKIGFDLISQLIWVKPHFALSRGDYHYRHEPLWYAVRKGKHHNWQGSRKEDSVWEIAGMNAMGASHDVADKATGHGTQKPIECMKKPIINNSKKGESIYDPFGGSGSTLIACEKTKRKCFMMEIDPIYCSVIIKRWETYTGKKAIRI